MEDMADADGDAEADQAEDQVSCLEAGENHCLKGAVGDGKPHGKTVEGAGGALGAAVSIAHVKDNKVSNGQDE